MKIKPKSNFELQIGLFAIIVTILYVTLLILFGVWMLILNIIEGNPYIQILQAGAGFIVCTVASIIYLRFMKYVIDNSRLKRIEK